MKKFLILAVLPALLVAGCSDYGQSNNAGYGTDGFGEESLGGGYTATSLNDAYLLAAAPKYYLGNPYTVEDVQYVPTEDMAYNQTGMAGIIPTELSGTKTSNGEIFDANHIVATSKTLPLPTIARVTNLDNGQSVVVRINNRGPFVNSRIMDLSPAAAKKIGMNGQTKVQIQVLSEQSQQVKDATLGIGQAETGIVEPVSQAPATVVTGSYEVQAGAFYSEDSATVLAQRLNSFGSTRVINEGGMYKVRIVGLDAAGARRTIDDLRNREGMAPGLLKDGRWINADSI